MSIHILAAMTEEVSAFSRHHLNSRVIGVGKVSAAIAGTEIRFRDPHGRVILVGTAAACDPELEIGDVVICSDTLHHDVDVTSLGFAPGQIPFREDWIWESDVMLRSRAISVCQKAGIKHVSGRIITGDQFISDPEQVAKLHKTFAASCIEMETAGLAQALNHLPFLNSRIPWLGIRVISDKADKSAPVDFAEFLPRASEVLSIIVEGIL